MQCLSSHKDHDLIDYKYVNKSLNSHYSTAIKDTITEIKYKKEKIFQN